MKRRIVRILVFLLLGAVVNVVVAWGCAIYVRTLSVAELSYLLNPKDALIGESMLIQSLGWIPTPSSDHFVYELHRYDEDAGSLRLSYWIEQENPTPSVGLYQGFVVSRMAARRCEAGWPRLSLTGMQFNTVSMDHVNFSPNIIWRGVNAIDMRHTLRESRILPTAPIWPGFAINTIFYAAILWVLFFVPGQLKRTLRRRRGLCLACAYPIGTSPVCTECGTELPSNARR